MIEGHEGGKQQEHNKEKEIYEVDVNKFVAELVSQLAEELKSRAEAIKRDGARIAEKEEDQPYGTHNLNHYCKINLKDGVAAGIRLNFRDVEGLLNNPRDFLNEGFELIYGEEGGDWNGNTKGRIEGDKLIIETYTPEEEK